MTGQATKFIPTAINNVHLTTANVLESMDPRFRVETRYRDGISTIALRARETVDVSMEIPAEHVTAWRAALSRMVHHALPVTVPMQGVSVFGSPILEAAFGAAISNPKAKLSISPNGISSTVKLVMFDPESQQPFVLDHLSGKAYVGESTARFVGQCCDNLVKLTLVVPLEESDDGATMTVELSLSGWEGVDVLQLPYFDNIAQLCAALGSGWGAALDMEVLGRQTLHGNLRAAPACDYYRGLNNYMGYLGRARSLARHTGVKLPLTSDLFSREQHVELEQVVAIFEERYVFDRHQLQSPPVTKVIADDGIRNIRRFVDEPDRHDIVCTFAEQEIEVFGRRVPLPMVEAELTGVRPRVDVDVETVKEGDIVSVSWEPDDDFRCVYRFVEGKAPQRTDQTRTAG